jgi:hypothetical protein
MPSEHVAEQVVAHDHVELLGPAHELHAASVGEDVVELDVLEFARVHLVDHLVPEHAGLHHVALLHRGEMVAALLRQLEADPRDALDLVGVVDLGVDRALLAVAQIGDGLGLAEIDAAGELAQDDDVEPFHHLALEARGFGERRVAHRRPDVGEQAEVLAQPQQARLRAHVIRHRVPFRPADRAEDHRVGGLGLGHRVVGDRDAVGVVAAAAHQPLFGLEAVGAAIVEEPDDLLHLGHHFGTDAVAGKQQKPVGCHAAEPRHSVTCLPGLGSSPGQVLVPGIHAPGSKSPGARLAAAIH